MFTGIIQTTGTIKKIETRADIKIISIYAPTIAPSKKIGDSIAIDGACLTITAVNGENFSVEAVPETIKKTVVKNYSNGARVNLENPLRIGDTLDGHFVSGHVDFVGTIKKIETTGESKTLNISFSESMAKFFAIKGSVTINGVSLTISKLKSNTFEVSLIPQTLKTTNLDEIKEESQVNIEVDLLSRYLDRLLQDRAQQINYEFLIERGFI